MAAVQKTTFTSSDPSTTSTLARTVEDKIRNLVPESAQILALVTKGAVKDGEVAQSKGMISKKATDTVRFEAFTHTPPEFTKTAGAVSSLTVTFSSVTDMYVRQVWENTANNTVGVVDLISGSDVTFVSVGSGTTFSVTEGDTLMRLGNAHEEGSSDPAYLQKPDDNVYNTTQIFRFPVEITGTADNIKHLAGGEYFARMKRYNLVEGLRDVERAFIFGKRASSGNKTTLTNVGVDASTTQGLWHFAQSEYDAGGNMTPQKFNKDLMLAMDSSVGNGQPIYMLTSREAVARAIEWQQSHIRIDQSKELAKYGVKAHKFVTSGADVHLIAHDAFDRGGHTNQALCFIPENVQYRYLKGRDLAPKMNIQSNSTDGRKDEILGEVGLLPLDGGYSITKVVNWF